jgi:Nitrogenase molybdenum-iron protein, alpha and beta chains
MSLTRFLPIPSDRMGILWTLLNIDDSVIVEYGPAGTTHYSMGLFGELGIEQENRLFTTHMREEDVVMGDTSRLEKAILEVDENFSPKVIFVSASSCSAVIGTDLRGVCTMVQPKIRAKLVAFEQGGFRGDYAFGLKAAYQLLGEAIVDRDAPKQPHTYNILGASSGSYRCKADMLEIERLMEEAFGMKCLCRLCLETDADAIAKMGGAELNLVIRQEALPLAQKLEQEFGTPFVYGAPYGYQGTADWLTKLGERLGKKASPGLLGELKKSGMELMQYRMTARMLRRDKMQAVLYGDYEAVRGLGAFLEHAGITPAHRISMHSLAALPEPEEGIEYYPAEKDRIRILRGLERTLVLADDTAKHLIADNNTFVRISTPLIDGSQIALHMPLMGPRGADMIRESIDGYLNTLR